MLSEAPVNKPALVPKPLPSHGQPHSVSSSAPCFFALEVQLTSSTQLPEGGEVGWVARVAQGAAVASSIPRAKDELKMNMSDYLIGNIWLQ